MNETLFQFINVFPSIPRPFPNYPSCFYPIYNLTPNLDNEHIMSDLNGGTMKALWYNAVRVSFSISATPGCSRTTAREFRSQAGSHPPGG